MFYAGHPACRQGARLADSAPARRSGPSGWVGAFGAIVAIGIAHWPTLMGAVVVGLGPVAIAPRVLRGAQGRELIPVLRDTGLFELLYGVILMITLSA
ncbi:hypothetical protein [Trueperella pyogenes]|uniref:hypothetical protein n=1 Tax=Trueperella pyogenes TaxID=1661 RepID=UPI0012D36D0A|nr:hypothetical protein [Trueperella pyogenes]